MKTQNTHKDLGWLQSKWWYRVLNIVYITGFILVGLTVISGAYTYIPHVNYSGVLTGSWYLALKILIIGSLSTFLFFEIIKRAFFYVAIQRSFMYGIKINKRKTLQILSVLAIIGFIAFYLNVQHSNKIALEKNKEEEEVRIQQEEKQRRVNEAITKFELEALEKLVEEKKIAQENHDERVLSCLNDAKFKYENDLVEGCKTLSQAVDKNYTSCLTEPLSFPRRVDDGFGKTSDGKVSEKRKSYCRNEHPEINDDCDLAEISNVIGFKIDLVAMEAEKILFRANNNYSLAKKSCQQ